MVVIRTERLIWNGKGAPVSLKEKWDLGKKALCCPPPKTYLGEKKEKSISMLCF